MNARIFTDVAHFVLSPQPSPLKMLSSTYTSGAYFRVLYFKMKSGGRILNVRHILNHVNLRLNIIRQRAKASVLDPTSTRVERLKVRGEERVQLHI